MLYIILLSKPVLSTLSKPHYMRFHIFLALIWLVSISQLNFGWSRVILSIMKPQSGGNGVFSIWSFFSTISFQFSDWWLRSLCSIVFRHLPILFLFLGYPPSKRGIRLTAHFLQISANRSFTVKFQPSFSPKSHSLPSRLGLRYMQAFIPACSDLEQNGRGL